VYFPFYGKKRVIFSVSKSLLDPVKREIKVNFVKVN
jgi:hypothetical protein